MNQQYQQYAVIREDKTWFVWRGTNTSSQSRFVIKQLKPDVRQQPHLQLRLRNEFQFFSGVAHDRLIRPLAEWPEEGAVVFEDVQGNLQQVLERHGPLPADQVVNAMLQILSALKYLHDKGIGHGALSPQSVLVDPSCQVKLGDFLGYNFNQDSPPPDRMLKYQAPEIINSSLGQCGPPADLYCLGYLTLEMLTGRDFDRLFTTVQSGQLGRPNWFGWHADLSKQLTGWREGLPKLPRVLGDLIDQLIHKDMAQRGFQRADELEKRLREAGLETRQGLPPLDLLATPLPAKAKVAPRPKIKETESGNQIGLEIQQAVDDHWENFRYHPGQQVLIGRQADCDIQLADTGVAHKHALLACTAGTWWIFDLHSKSGLALNGSTTTAAPLTSGDIVELGGERFRMVLVQVTNRPALGEFEIHTHIHTGRCGELYKAVWTKQNRKSVAVRIYPQEFADDAAQVRRFLRGIPAAAAVKHPNIVRLFKGGRCKTKKWGMTWFLAMEYMPGGSLRDVMQKQAGPLPVDHVVRFAHDIGSALKAANEQGLIHRNVSPTCILFDHAGHAKLGDFTLVRGVVLETMHRISAGVKSVLGDCVYQAPEIVRGEESIGPTCDLYSLAVCMFEALTGQLPLGAREEGRNLRQTIMAICNGQVPSPRLFNPAVSPALEEFLLKALSKKAEERYADANQFLQGLAALGASPAKV